MVVYALAMSSKTEFKNPTNKVSAIASRFNNPTLEPHVQGKRKGHEVDNVALIDDNVYDIW